MGNITDRKLSFYAAHTLARIYSAFCRVPGTGPGRKALRICPSYLGGVRKKGPTILVLESSHSTYCRDMMAKVLSENGHPVVANEGSSAESIADLFVRAGRRGSFKGQKEEEPYFVFDLDIAHAEKVLPYLETDLVVLDGIREEETLDEAGRPMTTRRLPQLVKPSTNLMLCGDDVMSFLWQSTGKKYYYGLDRLPGEKNKVEQVSEEKRLCPVCGARLAYEVIRSEGRGKFSCPSCGFTNPSGPFEASVDYDARALAMDGTSYWLQSGSEEGVYGQIAAIAALLTVGIPQEEIRHAFKTMEIKENARRKEKQEEAGHAEQPARTA